MTLDVAPLTGDALQDALTAVADLRIEVFRAFPYLYDGDKAYEERYLAKFAAHPKSVIVAAKDGDQVVGAATGTPLTAEHDAFVRPFVERGIDPETVFYCAESVLRPDYRGRGLGHRFFDLREAHARDLGCAITAFCAVVRPDDHSAKPEGYRPLDAFWQKRGYERRDDMRTTFAWKDLGEGDETEKPMVFWLKRL